MPFSFKHGLDSPRVHLLLSWQDNWQTQILIVSLNSSVRLDAHSSTSLPSDQKFLFFFFFLSSGEITKCNLKLYRLWGHSTKMQTKKISLNIYYHCILSEGLHKPDTLYNIDKSQDKDCSISRISFCLPDLFPVALSVVQQW